MHPIVDLLVSVVLVCAHLVWTIGWKRADLVGGLATSHRLLIYAALATVCSLAAGTNNAAVGSYASANGVWMDELRKTHGRTLRLSFRSISVWLWACTVLSIVAAVMDGDPIGTETHSASHSSEWIFEIALLIAVTKFARLSFLHDLVLKANDRSKTPGRKEPKRVRYSSRAG